MNLNDPDETERYHLGTTIGGRYLVERPIGEGAMGAVALARHVSLDEKVAVKFLRPELRRDPVAIARLSREAKALARIKSDHVARVLDVGVTLSVGPYMVMEYLEGTDLGEVIDTEGPLPVERVVEVVLQVCEALTVAHTAGITHRDIKPQNLFLARHGQFETLKVLDFGIAEDALGPSEPLDSGSGPPSGARGKPALYGTPSYMSPERVRNDPTTDHRADIWSVGVVLHELVTGRIVFDAPTLTEICARIVSDEPLDLETNEALLPPSLRAIVARCLERDVERRYQSVEELAAALAPLTTMQERFRGRSTGAFSRKLAEEELARLRSVPQLAEPSPASKPGSVWNDPWPGELARAAKERSRALLAGIARHTPVAWFSAHPLALYVAVAIASAAAVVLTASVGGGVRWMTPPPSAAPVVAAEVEARPLLPAPARAPQVAEPSSNTRLAQPDAVVGGATSGSNDHRQPVAPEGQSPEGQALAAPAPSAEPPSVVAPLLGSGSSAKTRAKANTPAKRAAPQRRHHRGAAVEREAEPVAPRAEADATADSRMRLVGDRAQRVRLVEDKLVTNRPQKPGVAPNDSSSESAQKSRSLPAWLQSMKPKAD